MPVWYGRPDVAALLAELGRRWMTNVLMEGGCAVLGSFLDAGVVDEVHVFVTPWLAGGAAAPTPAASRGAAAVAEALALARWEVTAVEGDVYLHGWRAE
jgi:diaminohydroxyphosphoribosylaminopyrimidine deaminase/5-amino-6-(5-phosphoribosylamino)uracil reductase